MSQPVRQRPISVGPVRAFEAVARHLSFRLAAQELHLTQSAISRQIQALEEDVGATLFHRGTRHVELTSHGSALLRAVAPWLDRMDATVRQIRQSRGRKVVSVSTFASFASLWLIPRLAGFQQEHPQIDIRVSASDDIVEPGSGDIDLALRYCRPAKAPANAVRLFGEEVTAVASPWLVEHARRTGRPLGHPRDLAHHTLLEEDSARPSVDYLAWRSWLARQGLPELQPQRWLYFDYTHQQVQAAIAGQGITLGRLPLIVEPLSRGELVEVFPEMRMPTPYAYWLVAASQAEDREELRCFCEWVQGQARKTCEALEAAWPSGEQRAGEAA
jgi:LysR family glycine cleavage system transcriptional activator